MAILCNEYTYVYCVVVGGPSVKSTNMLGLFPYNFFFGSLFNLYVLLLYIIIIVITNIKFHIYRY